MSGEITPEHIEELTQALFSLDETLTKILDQLESYGLADDIKAIRRSLKK